LGVKSKEKLESLLGVHFWVVFGSYMVGFSHRLFLKLIVTVPIPLLFYTAKKVNKKALRTASRSVATECHRKFPYISKNVKLALLKQSHFLYDT